MNDRYQADDRKGQTRRSAASAKPKTKAAASVRIESTTKTPKQKKAAQRAQRQQEQRIDRKYYNVPTDEYRKWRRIWWGMLIGAIAATALSFGLRVLLPQLELLSTVVLGIGYVGIIGALVLDGWKIRKIRKEYQAEMLAKETKEKRAEEKRAHAEALAARKASQASEGDTEVTPVAPKGIAASLLGLFGFNNLRSSAKRASEANKEAAAAQGSPVVAPAQAKTPVASREKTTPDHGKEGKE
jgi:hypothetical protein